MNKPPIKDVLSWDQFLNETLKEDSYPPKKIKLFNKRTKRQIKAVIIPHLLGSAVFLISLKRFVKKNQFLLLKMPLKVWVFFLKINHSKINILV